MKIFSPSELIATSEVREAPETSSSLAPESGASAALATYDAKLVAKFYRMTAAERPFPEPTAKCILAQLHLSAGMEAITRGELLVKLNETSVRAIPESSALAAIAHCIRLGLIDVLPEATRPHRLTGRPSHAIRLNVHGLRLLQCNATEIRILETAGASRASPHSLN